MRQPYRMQYRYRYLPLLCASHRWPLSRFTHFGAPYPPTWYPACPCGPDAAAAAALAPQGWIFIALTISGVRGQAIRCVPKCIMLATSGGIGLFLAFIGMQV